MHKLIEQSQHLEQAAFVLPVKDEISGVDVVALYRLGRQARRQPVSGASSGFDTDFQTLFAPNVLDLLTADGSDFPHQYGTDPAITIAWILPE